MLSACFDGSEILSSGTFGVKFEQLAIAAQAAQAARAAQAAQAAKNTSSYNTKFEQRCVLISSAFILLHISIQGIHISK